MIIKIHSQQELSNILWIDGQFVDKSVFDRIHYMSMDDFCYWQKSVNAKFIVVYNEQYKIIGVAKIGYYCGTAHNEKNYSISYFSIDKEYRGKGLSRVMLDTLFEYAKNNNLDISTSTYTVMGKQFLQPLFNEYAAKYNVQFYDRPAGEYTIQ